MSFGYADRLAPKKNLGGQLGAEEYIEAHTDVVQKAKQLAAWMKLPDAKVLAFTGAGISTSCGIPDFRGPKGIWTLRKKKEAVPPISIPFEYYRPSFTHQALSALVAAGIITHVSSQNVDSLHLRSGISRSMLAELHGNCFAERCVICKREYLRDFQVETVDFKPTGRLCSSTGCDGGLVDNVLDWGTALPEAELNQSVAAAEEASISLVLGTSLQIQPANEIPVLTRDAGGRMVIVNLQKTPKDRRASMIVRARVDPFMALVMRAMDLKVPAYTRTDSIAVSHSIVTDLPPTLAASSAAGASLTAATTASHLPPSTSDAQVDHSSVPAVIPSVRWGFKVFVHSPHGACCPLPMVQSMTAVCHTCPNIVVTCTSSPKPVGAAAVTEQLDKTMQEADLGAPTETDAHGVGAGASGLVLEAIAEAPVQQPPGGTDISNLQTKVAAATDAATAVASGTTAGSSQAATTSINNPGSAAGYVIEAHGVPHGVSSVSLTLQLRLVQWADEDKRNVQLTYVVQKMTQSSVVAAATSVTAAAPVGQRLGPGSSTGFVEQQLKPELAVKAEAEGVGAIAADSIGPGATIAGTAASNVGQWHSAASVLPTAETASAQPIGYVPAAATAAADAEACKIPSLTPGSGTTAHATGGTETAARSMVTLLHFVTQHDEHDAETVAAAFLANPPGVHMPKKRAPKHSAEECARLAAEAEARKKPRTAPTRASARHASKTC